MIRYVFWDSDNTLIDTFALHWAKHVNILMSHGIALEDRHKMRIHHNNGSQNWEWLTAELGLQVPEADYLQQIDDYYRMNAPQLQFLDGVQEALEIFQRAGLKQCVVSNGRRSSVLPAHEALGTMKYFEFVLCKEDYEGRKPDPSPYLTAIKKMSDIAGVDILPSECLAIEDDPLGVEAAKKAGMTTIYRPTKLVAQTSDFADRTVADSDGFRRAVHSIDKI